MRVVQGVGGAMLLANSTAIITDAFPREERGKAMGINSIAAIAGSFVGLVLLVIFVVIESRIAGPMFDLALFAIRPFTAGVLANLLSSIGRGGLQFMLIIWLQGVWLPLHGYSFESTPLWAGIFMLPLTLGILVSGPVAGTLADRYGSRLFAALGMIVGAAAFLGLMFLDADFPYPVFAALLFINGLGTGLFAAPNGTQIMNAVPAGERGQASGVRATTTNAGQVLSIGVFFSLMIIGLSLSLPEAMQSQLVAQGISPQVAAAVASEPPVASLFAAFLGYNPMGELVPAAALHALPAANVAIITGNRFFPEILAEPFMIGIKIAFSISIVLYLASAAASWLGGSTRKQERVEEMLLAAAEQKAA